MQIMKEHNCILPDLAIHPVPGRVQGNVACHQDCTNLSFPRTGVCGLAEPFKTNTKMVRR